MKMASTAQKALFYGVKLPFMLILMIFGFMMEYMVELPFNVMTRLDARSHNKRR